MPYISVGEIVKEKLKDDVSWFQGRYTQEQHDSGIFAPDDLIIELVIDKIYELDKNCILDGFPRNAEQCKIFVDKFAKEYFLVDITQDEEILLTRSSSRRICPNCNKIYALNNPLMLPNADNTCTNCGSGVIERADDNYETVKARLNMYEINYMQYMELLILESNAGINLHPRNSSNVNLIVEIIGSFIELSKSYKFKYIVDNFEND